MAKKVEENKTEVKPTSTVQQPQSVLIKNSKQISENPVINIKRNK